MIAFQADTSPEVRKFIVTFMEEARYTVGMRETCRIGRTCRGHMLHGEDMHVAWYVACHLVVTCGAVFRVSCCSKRDPVLLIRVVPILSYMMDDQSSVVIKRLLASVIQIYRLSLVVSQSLWEDGGDVCDNPLLPHHTYMLGHACMYMHTHAHTWIHMHMQHIAKMRSVDQDTKEMWDVS